MIVQVDALLYCNHHSKSSGPAIRGACRHVRTESLFLLWRPILYSSLIVKREARNHFGHRTEVSLHSNHCQPNPTLQSLCRAVPMQIDDLFRSNKRRRLPIHLQTERSC